MLTQNPSLLEHTIWCELQGDAGEPHVPLREGCVADGQNSMMSKDIAGIWVGYLENNPVLEKLWPHIQGKIGFHGDRFMKKELTVI